jgi:hypothetical protein
MALVLLCSSLPTVGLKTMKVGIAFDTLVFTARKYFNRLVSFFSVDFSGGRN